MKKQLLYLLSGFFAACSSEAPEAECLQPMRFAYYVVDGNQTTPATRAVAANLTETGINLYGAYHTAPFASNATETYSRLYWDTPINADGKAINGQERYWMNGTSALYTFWAHSRTPIGTPVGYGIIGGGGGGSGNQDPTCSIVQPDEPLKQMDVLAADQVKDFTAAYLTPVVNLYFRHLLSRVKIRFYNSHATQLNGCKASIKYGASVKKECSVNLGAKEITTSIASYHDTSTSHPLHDGTFAVATNAILPRFAYLAGDLILVPQTVQDGFITVTLSYTPEGAVSDKTVSVIVPKPGTDGKLASGKAYTYDIDVIEETYSLKIGDVTLSSWEGKDSSPIDWTEY